MSIDLIFGWFLGVISSLITGLFMFWLEGQREERRERLRQQQEYIRIALNWAAAGKRESLRGFNLQNANLSGKDLSGADLESANLNGTAMWSTDLSKANLRAASFRGAKIRYSNFRGAILRKAICTNAEFVKVDFTGSDLRDADLSQVGTVNDCIWDFVKINEHTKLQPAIMEAIKLSEKNMDGIFDTE